jgi:hypothetical protein
MLAPFKCRRWFAFLDDLPKTAGRSNASSARRRRCLDRPHNLLQPSRVALTYTLNGASTSQMRWRLEARDRPAFADALDADLRNRG